MTSVYCPEMHCLCTSGAYKQPNMRLFTLNEQDEWTLWRSNSDYFYPEMIPEPDYSDSGDDAGSESEEYTSFLRNSRPVTERLRDVTEVYVTNEDVKIKKPTSSKTSAGNQDISTRKQTSKTITERQPRKTSPKTLPKAPRKTHSKSPTKASKPGSPTVKTAKPQESAKKAPVKTKSQTSKLTTTTSTKRAKTPEGEKKISARPKSPSKAGGSKSKATARRTKSPEVVKKAPTKTKTTVQAVTEEKTKQKPKTGVESQSLKIKAFSKEKTEIKPSASTTKKEAGDAPKIPPMSSPSTDEIKSGISSAISTEHSSDDDLIKPRKLYQLSTEKQKLHKELKFSQRYGKLVSPKTELQLAIERFTENKEKKGLEIGEKTSLEKILEIQARKLNMQDTTDKPPRMDHLQRAPATLPNPKTEEFYRVHARVVKDNILTHCFLTDDDQSEYQSSQTLTQTESGSDS